MIQAAAPLLSMRRRCFVPRPRALWWRCVELPCQDNSNKKQQQLGLRGPTSLSLWSKSVADWQCSNAHTVYALLLVQFEPYCCSEVRAGASEFYFGLQEPWEKTLVKKAFVLQDWCGMPHCEHEKQWHKLTPHSCKGHRITYPLVPTKSNVSATHPQLAI